MDVRLGIAVASEALNVSEFCRRYGISRQSFYQWRRRYRAEGLGGLEPRSRAPRHSPRRVALEIEEAVVALRKELTDLGVRRISVGGSLSRTAWTGFLAAAREITDHGTFESVGAAVSFADLNALAGPPK